MGEKSFHQHLLFEEICGKIGIETQLRGSPAIPPVFPAWFSGAQGQIFLRRKQRILPFFCGISVCWVQQIFLRLAVWISLWTRGGGMFFSAPVLRRESPPVHRSIFAGTISVFSAFFTILSQFVSEIPQRHRGIPGGGDRTPPYFSEIPVCFQCHTVSRQTGRR